MTTNLSRYKADLDKLVETGKLMLANIKFRHFATTRSLTQQEQDIAKKVEGNFENKYQRWYTEALTLISQLTPERKHEFELLYKGEGKRRDIDAANYNIQDWLNGVRSPARGMQETKIFDDFAAAAMRFKTQQEILEATAGRFESSLFDVKQLVQADLLDSELEAAEQLAKHGYRRGAGAIAGVVLEKHLAEVVKNHQVSIRKQHPTISDFNDALKGANVVDIPQWRFIQHLGDIRNLCDHGKTREPSADEIQELIAGAARITKTMF